MSGKTTFTKHLIGKEFPGANIGPEPTTDRFTILQYGAQDQLMKGPAFIRETNQARFSTAKKLGADFVNSLQGVWTDSKFLQNYSIVDTPGMLSVKEKPRSYDMQEALGFFAEEAAIIIFMFDVNKVDVNQETNNAFQVLLPHFDKIRFVLNKAHEKPMSDLLHIYGALLWHLRLDYQRTEVPHIYVTSFPDTKQHQIAIDEVGGHHSELLKIEASPSHSDHCMCEQAAALHFNAFHREKG